eukprot:maker-scaffold_9-snap-gene-0.3-mRNA-1 protein AED:0.13 eAED:0.13 QI:0/0/0/0.5/1/1/2/0/413
MKYVQEIGEELSWEMVKPFVLKRKPFIKKEAGKINNLSKIFENLETNSKLLDFLRETNSLGMLEDKIECEEKTSEYRYFGQGNTVLLSFQNFLNSLSSENSKYYMSSSSRQEFSLMNTFLLKLYKINTFPLTPDFMKSLIPAWINIWWGKSDSESSSGLHHDFHDNIYLLIRGRKKFKIFPPSCFENMYLSKKVDKIFSNGLITYEGDELNPDGSDKLLRKKHMFQKKLQEELNDDEEDKILDELLELEAALEVEFTPPLKKQKFVSLPKNFSKIRTTREVDLTKFPKFDESKGTEVILEAGDLLYLPCGWFHEVFSVSEKDSEGHLAFNYWFHPPDVLESVEGSNLYSTSYWKDIFTEQIHDLDLKKRIHGKSKKVLFISEGLQYLFYCLVPDHTLITPLNLIGTYFRKLYK